MEQDVINSCKFMLVADIISLCIFGFFTSDMTRTCVCICRYAHAQHQLA